MAANTVYPFERNRYYAGKLLTAIDFQVEQNYVNNKRQFLNQFMFGQGVICGLSVLNLDDFSIMIESGIAIDGCGREIVVDSTVVKKLSIIEGFSTLKTDQVTLCLRYEETATQSVYALQKQSQDHEFEYNRISESYGLCLMDTSSMQPRYETESEFYSHGRLYSDDSHTVDLTMPSVVSAGTWVKLILNIKRHSVEGGDISIQGILQTPSFTLGDGQRQLEINERNIHLEQGETYENEYWLLAQKQENNVATIIANAENIRIIQNGQEKIAPTSFSLRTAIKSVSPNALITKEIGRQSLEMHNIGFGDGLIRLAEFDLIRTENSYVIDKIFDLDAKHYIAMPAQERLRAEYSSFYRDASISAQNWNSVLPSTGENTQPPVQKELQYANGMCDIPLSANAKAGDVFYSGEILHGLGRGDVYITAGLHYLMEDETLGTKGRCTICGDANLFLKEELLPIPNAKIAVKMFNDKGSFVVAVELDYPTDLAMVEINWSAIKLPRSDGLDYVYEQVNCSIIAETATISLVCGESHFFNVLFKNMEPCSLRYSLIEENSGEINRHGVYTAPSKEGIYEIKFACAEIPAIHTYAYAVVKKKVDMQ